jgi:hypothetical protein
VRAKTVIGEHVDAWVSLAVIGGSCVLYNPLMVNIDRYATTQALSLTWILEPRFRLIFAWQFARDYFDIPFILE